MPKTITAHTCYHITLWCRWELKSFAIINKYKWFIAVRTTGPQIPPSLSTVFVNTTGKILGPTRSSNKYISGALWLGRVSQSGKPTSRLHLVPGLQTSRALSSYRPYLWNGVVLWYRQRKWHFWREEVIEDVKRETALGAVNAKIGVKEMGYDGAYFSLRTLLKWCGIFRLYESYFSSYVPLSSSKKVCCPGGWRFNVFTVVQVPYCNILDISLSSP